MLPALDWTPATKDGKRKRRKVEAPLRPAEGVFRLFTAAKPMRFPDGTTISLSDSDLGDSQQQDEWNGQAQPPSPAIDGPAVESEWNEEAQPPSPAMDGPAPELVSERSIVPLGQAEDLAGSEGAWLRRGATVRYGLGGGVGVFHGGSGAASPSASGAAAKALVAGPVEDLMDRFAFEGAAFPPGPAGLTVCENAKAARVARERDAMFGSQLPAPSQPQILGSQMASQLAQEPEDFSAMPLAEQERIRRKWGRFADGATDTKAARMQLLVAAILHPKATEASVLKGLEGLRAWAARASGGSAELTAERLAGASGEELVEHLEGVHWHKTKAARVVAAATVVLYKHGGLVPSDRVSLLRLPGIGNKLAELLVFVFRATESQEPEPLGLSAAGGEDARGEDCHDTLVLLD